MATASEALRQRARTLTARKPEPDPVTPGREIDETIINEIMSQPAAESCRCGITPGITFEQLRALEAGCTDQTGGYVCPVLCRLRRRLGV